MKAANASVIIVRKRHAMSTMPAVSCCCPTRQESAGKDRAPTVSTYEIMSKPVLLLDPDMDVRHQRACSIASVCPASR